MVISGTGHRPDKLGGYGDAVADALRSLATERLADLKPHKVISGLALGWDTALAEAAADLNIPLIGAVPFVGQESMWPATSRARYKTVLARCVDVKICSPGGYAPYKMQARNQWMVDNSDLVLALWNGSLGGTANCVRYAEVSRKPIINCWDKFKEKK